MKNFFKNDFIWIVIMFTIGYVICSVTKKPTTLPDTRYEQLLRTIDSLNIKLDSLSLEKDSLVQVIDSSKANVQYLDKWYEKELINITNQSIASDVVFFTEYLSKADVGFVSSYNSTAAKGN